MKKGNTLTLKKLNEFYEKMKDIPQPTVYYSYEGWLINWRFPFIHRVKGGYFK